jgi:nicotinate-nucleotide pyrophosphorylase (carboxylating)
MIAPLPDLVIEGIVQAALAEDLGRAGDVTSQACVPLGTRLKATFAARRPGVVSGLACARLAVLAMDPQAEFRADLADGDPVGPGSKLA